MSTENDFHEKIYAICNDVANTSSLEDLYERLIHFISRLCEFPTSAFMTVAEYGLPNQFFHVVHATGRFAKFAGETLLDEHPTRILREAISQRTTHYEQNAIAFLFPHPENFAVVVYIEMQHEFDSKHLKQLFFLISSVTSAIQIHTSAKLAERTNRATVMALAGLAEHKDQITGEHIMRVAIMTDEIVQVLAKLRHYEDEITPEFMRLIGTASILHDVGKVAIPDSLLQKPGALTADERKLIDTHTIRGQEVLEKVSRLFDGNNYLLKLSSEIALYHHEHYDGRGYPTRRAGQDIPLAARIVGLSDVYDALTSARPYKHAWSDDEATAYISNQAGRQFDPFAVEAFLKVMAFRKEAALISWTEDMSVNVGHLDNDHRFLIELINQLSSAEKIGNRRIVESVLDELINYTLDHFQREEQFLLDNGFPDFAKHKQLHTSFTDTIQDLRWQYLHGFRPLINREILRFLKNWLSKHILVEDMKYATRIGASV